MADQFAFTYVHLHMTNRERPARVGTPEVETVADPQLLLLRARRSVADVHVQTLFTHDLVHGIVDPKQIAAIRNASRFIGTAMTESNYNSVVSDNRKTYHQNQSVTVNVDSLAVRDTRDIYALAMEIDALKRRVLRGKGGQLFGRRKSAIMHSDKLEFAESQSVQFL